MGEDYVLRGPPRSSHHPTRGTLAARYAAPTFRAVRWWTAGLQRSTVEDGCTTGFLLVRGAPRLGHLLLCASLTDPALQARTHREINCHDLLQGETYPRTEAISNG